MAQNCLGNEMIIRVYRAFDWPSSMSRTKVMTQKSRFSQNSKNCRKSMSFPLTAFFPEWNCRELSIES